MEVTVSWEFFKKQQEKYRSSIVETARTEGPKAKDARVPADQPGQAAGKKEKAMKSKLITAAVVGLLMLAGTVKSFAASTANAYLILRCTSTISVDLVNGGLYGATTYYNFGDVAAASTRTIPAPIGVRNTSSGAPIRHSSLSRSSVQRLMSSGS